MNKKIIIILITLIVLIMICMSIIIVKLNNSKEKEEVIYDTGEAVLTADAVSNRVNRDNLMFFTISKCIKDSLKVDYNIYIWDMYCVERVSNSTYFANIVTNKKESLYVAINLDNDANAYNIEVISKSDFEYITTGGIPEKYKGDIYVDSNKNNSIKYSSLNNESISNNYFNMINDLLINYPEVIYEKLAEEYKNARFESYEDFAAYCINRTDFIGAKEYVSYSYGVVNGNKTYKTKDTNGNIYIIEEVSSGGFKIYLDDYTVDTEEFKKLYEKADETLKASTNAEKFIKMLNNKDYSLAYKILNEGYKKNSFPSQTSYEQYLIDNFYTTNLIKSSGVEKQGNYYIVTLDLSEGARASARSQTKKVIISLGEETNFEMSIALD